MKHITVMLQIIVLGSLVGCGESSDPAESTNASFRQSLEHAVHIAQVQCALHFFENRADCNACAHDRADALLRHGAITQQQTGALIQAVVQDACALMPFCGEPDFYQPSGPHRIFCRCFDEQGELVEFCGDAEDCNNIVTLCLNLCRSCTEDTDEDFFCDQNHPECPPE